MPDVDFEIRLIEVLRGDAALVGLLGKKGSQPAITVGHFAPVALGKPLNKGYPHLTFIWESDDSHEIITATRGTLRIWVWVLSTEKESYKVLTQLINRVKKLINRNPDNILSKTNGEPLVDSGTGDFNPLFKYEGLKVTRCVKKQEKKNRDSDEEKHFGYLSFDVVLSEDMDFDNDDLESWDCP